MERLLLRRAVWCLITVLMVVPMAHSETSEYYDLGDYQRVVTTTVPEAQTWFDRGLLQSYGFNHEEAVRCYQKALELDAGLAMAHWGIAHALGPNYNNPAMEEAAAVQAYESIQQAQALAPGASPVEQALIGALAKRYAQPVPEDRAALETAYADAMRAVYKAYPGDADVAGLFAEALMQLRPWALWSAAGEPAPGTIELCEILELALQKAPDHPSLCHFYIHVMEPSPFPEKALAAENVLRDRVPQAGHLVHMPSHMVVLLGD
jgi:tetratricopeptide (TPR) repeat protein